MISDKLKSYRVDNAYTEGVIIPLERAPDVECRVVLPGKHNRAYLAELYGSIEVKLDGDAEEAKTSLLSTRDRIEQAFVKHCLVAIDGEPVPDDLDIAREHPDLLEELMTKANAIAELIQADVEAAEKAICGYLRWQHRWHGKVEFYEKLMESGKVADEDVMPNVDRYAPILSAFMELSTERQIGMSIGPIPMSKVTDYLERYKLPSWWAQVISAADATAMRLHADENQRESA